MLLHRYGFYNAYFGIKNRKPQVKPVKTKRRRKTTAERAYKKCNPKNDIYFWDYNPNFTIYFLDKGKRLFQNEQPFSYLPSCWT